MTGFIDTPITITLNYNRLWQLTINDCLRLAPFLTELRVSSLHCDWLGFHLRIGHFISFRCPLVHTPQLNFWILWRLSRVSVVGIATGYGLDDRGVSVRVPVASRIFLLHVAQTCSGAHPVNGYRGIFPRGGKAAWAWSWALTSK
jgi:hypothetical protein